MKTVFSDKQEKVIAELERALKKCAGCKIALFGTGDNEMRAFDADAVRRTGYGRSEIDPLEALHSLDQGQSIKDYGAYWDSIAW